ncbi:MAG: hypothetical protein M1826_002492 [Phylliscum demangeonii]|nr:MAG: hypothetical protein M1826_002492 [Phylliscum demangeonii]
MDRRARRDHVARLAAEAAGFRASGVVGGRRAACVGQAAVEAVLLSMLDGKRAGVEPLGPGRVQRSAAVVIVLQRREEERKAQEMRYASATMLRRVPVSPRDAKDDPEDHRGYTSGMPYPGQDGEHYMRHHVGRSGLDNRQERIRAMMKRARQDMYERVQDYLENAYAEFHRELYELLRASIGPSSIEAAPSMCYVIDPSIEAYLDQAVTALHIA